MIANVANADATITDSPPEEPAAYPYRMKDLCERTGMPRQAIHFYIQQGLLPQGKKTGRNMAYYGEEHVQRVLMIRKLQHERFLPLKAIKALLDEQEGSFTREQRSFLDDLRARLGGRLFPTRTAPVDTCQVSPLLERANVPRSDFEQLVELGVLGVGRDQGGETIIAADNAWIVELWGAVRGLGFSPENGFSVADFAIYEDSVTKLFERETAMLKERFAKLDPELAAGMIERALPLLNDFLARYHATLIRNFFAGT
jgi:DNA-binding transcriptional MerR regulator